VLRADQAGAAAGGTGVLDGMPGRVGAPGRRLRLSPVQARRSIDFAGLRLAPAAAAAALAALHVQDAGIGVIAFATTFGCAQAFERTRFPLSLLPAARAFLTLAAPVGGALLALLLLALAGSPRPAGEFVAPVFGAWLVAALGYWTKMRVDEAARIRVAVAGGHGFVRDLIRELAVARVRGFHVVGWLGDGPVAPGAGALRWLGAIGEVGAVVEREGIDLVVCGPGDCGTESTEAAISGEVAALCVDHGVRVLAASQLYEELFGHVPIGTIDAAWYRYITHPRFRSSGALPKRLFDLVLGIPLLLVSLPLIAVCAAAVALEDGRPVFYRQQRLGARGRAFEIVKLRTMAVDAEADGRPQWASADDERVTAVGRVLRRTHLDELPQLWNVLRGEMTLVGPRPERPEIVEGLEGDIPHYSRRHLVKPGVTGWAAVRCGYSGSELGSAWKACHDLFYIKHRSVFADLLILIETALVTFRDAHRALPTPGERFILGTEASPSTLADA